MGFKTLRYGDPRHPAIQTTGLLILAVASPTPAEHTSFGGRYTQLRKLALAATLLLGAAQFADLTRDEDLCAGSRCFRPRSSMCER
jgi:hypothetical protein